MSPLDLRRLDLNLLRTFDVLMRQRSVSGAARELHRTQSAVSHALTRLRGQLGDPLLVRVGGRMEPSAYALSVAGQVQALLREIERVLTQRERFNPASSTRGFRLALPDFFGPLFAQLCAQTAPAAPGIGWEWELPGDGCLRALAAGELDAALLPSTLACPDALERAELGALAWVCALRQGHPAAGDWSARTWAACGHVQVRVGERGHQPLQSQLPQRHLGRRVAVVLPGFAAVGELLARTDHVATLPEPLLREQAARWGLRLLPVPVPLKPVPFALYWSRRHDGQDGALRWLRERMRAAWDASMPAAPPAGGPARRRSGHNRAP